MSNCTSCNDIIQTNLIPSCSHGVFCSNECQHRYHKFAKSQKQEGENIGTTPLERETKRESKMNYPFSEKEVIENES